MPKEFTIKTRKQLFHVPSNRGISDPIFVDTYDEKDFSNPLRVFVNHEEEIPDGTIVGVMLQAKETTSWSYQASSYIEVVLSSDVKVCTRSEAQQLKDCNQKLIIVDDKTFRFNAVYEHFFRVRCRRSDNNSFDLEPVFLDSKCVLRKAFEHSFVSSINVPIEYISDREFLISQYLKATNSAEVDLDDSYVFAYDIKIFIEAVTKLSSNETAITNKLVKRIKSKVPFNHYKNVIDPLSGVGSALSWATEIDVPLYRFYEAFEKHRDLLVRLVFTQAEELEAIGSWQQVIEYSEELYHRAVSQLGTEIEIPIEYSVNEVECLVPAVLDASSLTRICKASIFRVFLPDQTHCLRSTVQLISWGGNLLPPVLLDHLQPGNIVRIIYSWSSSPDRWGKLYVTLLKRIDQNRFLVSLFSVYSTFDENFLFVIDKSAILELPLEWTGNENLQNVLPSLTPPREIEEEEPPRSLVEQMNHFMSPDYADTIMNRLFFIPLNYENIFD